MANQLKKMGIAMALLGTMTLTSVAVFAEEPMHGGPSPEKMEAHKKEMMDEFFSKIDATPAQKKQIEALHTQFELQKEPIEKAMWQQRKELMLYTYSPSATKDGAMQKEAQIDQLKSQLGNLEIEMAFAKKAVLTPEQQKKASDLLEDKSEKMEKMHEKFQEKKMDKMTK